MKLAKQHECILHCLYRECLLIVPAGMHEWAGTEILTYWGEPAAPIFSQCFYLWIQINTHNYVAIKYVVAPNFEKRNDIVHFL